MAMFTPKLPCPARRTAVALAMALSLAIALTAQAAPQHMPAAVRPAVAVPEEVGLSGARLERLSHTLQQYVDDGRVAGVVALVARRGRVAYHEAFGERDLEAGAPMATDTIFRIASQSKAVTSVAAMILVEEGRLRLTDLVAKFIPGFGEAKVAVANDEGGTDLVDTTRPIIVHDLLTHTSGLSYGAEPVTELYREADVLGWYFADKDEPIGATIDRLAALPLNAEPGGQFLYGFSTDVLGAVIERASGLDLDTFFRSRIFEPLGMHDTHFYLPPDKRERLAAVYMATQDGGIERAPDPGMIGQGAYVDGPRKSFSGGAGLLSTANDYARFLQMMLNGGELDGVRILSPKTVELMTVDHLGDRYSGRGTGFGLGFQVTVDLGASRTHGSVGAYGWGGAYYTTYWVDPAEDMVVTFMTQLLPAGNLDLQDKFKTLVYQAIVD